jgi:hypothetical protein
MSPEALRAAKPVAPPELRERVRLIAAAEPAPRRRLPWRRITLVAAPAALAAAAIAGVVVGVTEQRARVQPGQTVLSAGPVHGTGGAVAPGPLRTAAPAPAPARFQDYDAAIRLLVPDANAVSERTKRALAIVRSLGGVVTQVDVRTSGTRGSAFVVARVPIGSVTSALQQLSALGRILGQHVAILDAQRRIAELRGEVEHSTGAAKAAAQARLEAELRKARLSTLSLSLTTPAPAARKPHHESTAGRILHAEGRVALYVGLIGGPLLALALAVWLVARSLRRLAERRLLGA